MDAESTPSDATSPGLRERRRLETERELADAALDLFERNGVNGTTVDDIAHAAGVSARTFFRYAQTKEHALFLGGPALEGMRERALDAIRDGGPVAASLEAAWLPAIDQLDAGPPGERERLLRINRLVLAEPNLLALALARDEREVAELVEGILAATDGAIDELHARALVTVVGTIVRLSIDAWVRQSERGDASDASVRDLYLELRRGLAASFSDSAP